MKILIVGGSSLLGKYLVKTASESQLKLLSPYIDYQLNLTYFSNSIETKLPVYALDICNPSWVQYIFSRVQPDLVIHCSAIGSVDYAETHYAETEMVNAIGTKNIIAACKSFKSKLVYISTNAVFSGDNPPYKEDAERHPVNAYGAIKRQAEQLVLDSELDWMIIRPFLLYGWPYPGGRQNWMTTILDKLDKGQRVNLVKDVYWQPTSAKDCASTIWKLVSLNQWKEIYHVASDDRITLYEFGLKVSMHFKGQADNIYPILSKDIKGIARRPEDTTFDLTKLHNLGIKLQTVGKGLEEMKVDLNKEKLTEALKRHWV